MREVPNNPELEIELIAAALSTMEDQAKVRTLFLSIDYKIFFMHENELLVKVAQSLIAKNHEITLATLKSEGASENVLMEAFQRMHSDTGFETTLHKLNELHSRRMIIKAANQALEQAYKKNELEQKAASTIVSELCRDANDALFATRDSLKHLSSSFREIEKRIDVYRNGGLIGASTGFKSLDKITGGWQRGDFYVLGGESGMGKTALVTELMRATSKKGGHVALFELEMSRLRTAERVVYRQALKSYYTATKGNISNQDLKNIARGMGELSQYGFYVDDTPDRTIAEIEREAYRLQGEIGKELDLLCVDNIQITALEGERNPQAIVKENSKLLKSLAKNMNIPVLAISHLNNDIAGRNDKRPIISDLAESKDIRKMADSVMMLYRPHAYDDMEPENKAELIFRKNRNGPEGVIHLEWDGPLMGFGDWIDESEKRSGN